MNPLSIVPPLWHRRAASVLIPIGLTALLIEVYLLIQHVHSTNLPLVAAISLALIGVLTASIAVLPVPDKVSGAFSFIAYLAELITVMLSLYLGLSTDAQQVFILLTAMLALISGMFGPIVWIGLVVLLAPFVFDHYSDGGGSITGIGAFTLLFAVPLVAGWLLWRVGVRTSGSSQNAGDGTTGQGNGAYDTLAEQLDAVSNESEIVINTIADGVVALNGEGLITLINPAALDALGWTKQDAMGLDFRTVLDIQNRAGKELDDELHPIAKALQTNEPAERNDLFMVTRMKKVFDVRLGITPAGEPGKGLIIVFQDITKEKAEEHEQAEFVSTASHEMRTPVAAIEGYLGLALNPQTAAIDDKARMYLTKAHESSQHLGRLFADLLDVTKADDGRLRNLPAVTDLGYFSASVARDFEVKAQDKDLTLTFASAATTDMSERRLSPVFYADFDNDHMREVLGNLIENAIKYTKSGTVRVNVAGNETTVRVSISDSGIGIPREDMPHLFQKFYRVDNSDTREIGGTGLGLYLCRRLVELMNGKIWVESEYGKGSTFVVSLPRLSYEDAQERLQAVEEQRQRDAAAEASKATSTSILPGTPLQ